MIPQFFFLQYEDTILPGENADADADVRTRKFSRRAALPRGRRSELSEDDEVSGSSHSSLADTLLGDFANLPGKADTDMDEFAVINVGPSVVPNPYVPTFRVFAYNTTGDGYSQSENDALEVEGSDDDEDEVNAARRDHSHKHPNRKKEKAECKKKKEKNKDKWACRPRKAHHASGRSPSRTNRLWSPLGFAQVRKFPEALCAP